MLPTSALPVYFCLFLIIKLSEPSQFSVVLTCLNEFCFNGCHNMLTDLQNPATAVCTETLWEKPDDILDCYTNMDSDRIDLGDITQHNIKQLKLLNQVILPVTYNDKFYKDVLDVGDLAKLAFFNDIVVGAVCCRIDNTKGKKRLYIMTLGCLAPYRQRGVGTLLLQHVFKICQRDKTIAAIFLHVQVNNESALGFYKKFGFSIVETEKQYYKRIEPSDAFVLEKDLTQSSADDIKITFNGRS